MSDNIKGILKNFGPEADKPELIDKIEFLSKLHALSIEDLYIKWEQFSYNQKHENQTDLNINNLDEFKQYLQQQIEKKAADVANSSNPSINMGNSSIGSITSSAIKKPNIKSKLFGVDFKKTSLDNKRRKIQVKQEFESSISRDVKAEDISNVSMSDFNIKTEDSSILFNPSFTKPSSTESGTIIDSLNPNNIDTATGIRDDGENQVKIQAFYDPNNYKFRTMRQNLVDVSDVLDEQIEIFTKLIERHFNLTDGDIGDPTIQSQTEIYAVGRIVPDSPTAEGFLNVQSLSLETSRINGIGRRIRLNLENIPELSLFNGQLVGVRGKNANGEFFLVNELLELPYPDAPVSTENDILEYQQIIGSDLSKTIVTAGPYIPDNELDFSHLQRFVDKVNNDIKPHIIIMFGPFIDVTNSLIMEGNIPNFPFLKQQPRTLDELFAKLMLPILKKIDPRIQVILIPSTRDALSNHASYPQNSLDRKALNLPKNFKCFTNPCTFQLNETYVGCSNVDIFKDMKEVIKGDDTSIRNRFDRIGDNLLQQRRYYPVFPGSIRKVVMPDKDKDQKVYKHLSGADIDVSYLGLTEFVGNFAPDIIIIPSDMQPFAKIIRNVIFINPGRFVKMKGTSGTHAQISITPAKLDDNSLSKVEGEETLYLHNVWKRSRVDIVSN